jgi:hypothetical protein
MVKKTVEDNSSTTATTTPIALTLQDLVLVAQIIQLTSQRGAFKAEEMAQVGELYNKLIAFLQTTGAVSPATATTEEQSND